MNSNIPERIVQGFALLGVWLAFLLARAGGGASFAEAAAKQGMALPVPTMTWLAWSASPWSFVVPVACTIAILALWLRRSANANWVGGAVLVVALFYALAGQFALGLPFASMCGCIK